MILTPYSFAILTNLISLKNFLFLPPSKAAVGTLTLIIHSLFLNIAPTLNLDLLFTLSENFALGDLASSTFSLLYPRIPKSNSASKHTTSFLKNLSESISESTLRTQPCRKYILRNNRLFSPSPSLSLPSTNTSLLRHHAQSRSSESFSSGNNIPTSGVHVAVS